jgi:pimeloyl-ACP methyl ester carboxylesterase
MAMLPKTREARAKIGGGAGQSVGGKAYAEWQEKLWDRPRKDGVLQMPVLMVAGSDDVIDWPANSPMATLERELGLFNIVEARNPKVEMIVISNGGHFMYREHPDEFNAALIGFIEFWRLHPQAPAISVGRSIKPSTQD